jgi:hypothetical protein
MTQIAPRDSHPLLKITVRLKAAHMLRAPQRKQQLVSRTKGTISQISRRLSRNLAEDGTAVADITL